MEIPDLLVSLIYICATLALAEFQRKLVRSFVRSEFLQCALQEFVASFELCVVCYELGIVEELHGGLTYGLFLFLATIWWTTKWGDITGCPYNHLEEWIDGNFDLLRALAFTVMDVLGGAVFFRYYLKYIWSMGYGEVHMEHLHNPECRSDINTSPWIAGLIEGSAVCVCQLLGKYLGETEYATVINAFVGTALVVAAYDTSGGYFSPSLATALQYGCSGATIWEHFLVYWLSTMVGAVVAYYVWKTPRFSKSISEEKPSEDTKKLN